jgi:hypothetical protein
MPVIVVKWFFRGWHFGWLYDGYVEATSGTRYDVDADGKIIYNGHHLTLYNASYRG